MINRLHLYFIFCPRRCAYRRRLRRVFFKSFCVRALLRRIFALGVPVLLSSFAPPRAWSYAQSSCAPTPPRTALYLAPPFHSLSRLTPPPIPRASGRAGGFSLRYTPPLRLCRSRGGRAGLRSVVRCRGSRDKRRPTRPTPCQVHSIIKVF